VRLYGASALIFLLLFCINMCCSGVLLVGVGHRKVGSSCNCSVSTMAFNMFHSSESFVVVIYLNGEEILLGQLFSYIRASTLAFE